MEVNKPDISIFGSAHRPQYWMDLYHSIGKNRVKFEIVFVGPNPPDYELPENFRFIRSFVKPTQCAEIAARNARADLIMDMPDDCEFVTLEPLDKLYDFYVSGGSDKLIVSSRMMTDGEDQSHFAHRFFVGDENTPLMPLCGLMSKKFYRELGGIDKSFIAVMWPLDMAMRAYAAGGRVELSHVYMNEDRGKCAGSNLCGEFWERDRGLLEYLWTDNGKLRSFRRKAPVSFSGVDILEISQGPRGRWRGSAPLLVEKAQDHLFKYSLVLKKINRGIRQPSKYMSYLKRMAACMKG